MPLRHGLRERVELIFAPPDTLATGDNAPWIPNKLTIAYEILGVYAVLKTAPSGLLTIDILKATQASIDTGTPVWTTIFTTKLTVDASELSSNTAAAAAALNGTQLWEPGDHLRVNLDSGVAAAAGLSVTTYLRARGS